MQESLLYKVPDEIKLDIIRRLDPESIGKLKRLNKYWYDFIAKEMEVTLYASLLRFSQYHNEEVIRLDQKFVSLQHKSKIGIIDYFQDSHTEKFDKFALFIIGLIFTLGLFVYNNFLYTEIKSNFDKDEPGHQVLSLIFFSLLIISNLIGIVIINYIIGDQAQTWHEEYSCHPKLFADLSEELLPEKKFLMFLNNDKLEQLYQTFDYGLIRHSSKEIFSIFREVKQELDIINQQLNDRVTELRLTTKKQIDLKNLKKSRQNYLQSRISFWEQDNSEETIPIEKPRVLGTKSGFGCLTA